MRTTVRTPFRARITSRARGTRAAARVSRSEVDERSRGGSRRIRTSRRRHATSSAGSSNEAHFSFRAAAVSDLVFQPNEGCAQLFALPSPLARERTRAAARVLAAVNGCVLTLVRPSPNPQARLVSPESPGLHQQMLALAQPERPDLGSLFRVAAPGLSWRFFSQITDAHNCSHPLPSMRSHRELGHARSCARARAGMKCPRAARPLRLRGTGVLVCNVAL